MSKTPRGQRSVYAVKHGGRDTLGSLPAVGTLLGVVAALAIAVVAIVVWSGGPLAAKDLEAEPEGSDKQVLQSYEDLPLTFVENRGQTDERVRYHAQSPDYAFYFTTEEVVLSLVEKRGATAGEDPSADGVVLALRFINANPDVVVEGEDRAPGEVNYLRGDDPDGWQTELPGYTSVVYRELWPGIDMVLYGQDGQLKYEFRLRPGADISDIQLAYAGAEGLTLDEAGGLLIETPLGKLQDSPPVSYQEIDGERVPVESRYALSEDGDEPGYGFAVGAYNPDQELVIDPGVEYSTFLGGSSDDDGNSIAVDANGNTYIVGDTQSTNFPTTTGAFDRSFNGGTRDVFVSKLNANGSGLVYSTYLGGSPTALPAGGSDNLEFGRAIAVDSNGNAYITGQTSSSNFPTTSGAFDRTLSVSTNNAIDGFVTKLNATGSGLVYSTYLGGASPDDGRSIAVDSSGTAYIAGETDSSNFPTTSGAFDTTKNSGRDAFVTKLNATGSSLAYSTYLGGSDNDISNRVRVDGNGSAYVGGATRSTNFPTTQGAYQPTHSGGGFADLFEGYVTKLSPNGSTLAYSTFLGGSRVDRVNGLDIDTAGNAYVVGGTLSHGLDTVGKAFPTTPSAFDTAFTGTSESFATKLNSTGSGLAYSTFMGGGGGASITVDAERNAWVIGSAGPGAPTTPDGFQTQFGGGSTDAHLAQLNANGSALGYATFLGGGNSETGLDMVLDTAGNLYVTGTTFSTNFPTTAGAFDRTFAGDPSIFWGDAFVTKFSAGDSTTEPPPPEPEPVALSSLSLNPATVTGGESSTGTVTLDSVAPAGGTSVTLSSSNTNAATVPTGVTIPEGSTSRTFTVSTSSVSSDTSSTISASYNGVTRTASLTVNAPSAPSATLSSLTLNPTTVTGGESSTGTVTLDSAAPTGGAEVEVFSSNTDVATTPDNVTVPAGETSATFTVSTNTVDFDSSSAISARAGGVMRSVILSVTPSGSEPEPDPVPAVSSLTLDPNSVTGGESSTSTVTLDAAAPSGGAAVELVSVHTDVATVPASVTVPANETSATFTVSTSSVDSDTSATIRATYGGATQSAVLLVAAPDPEPDPGPAERTTSDFSGELDGKDSTSHTVSVGAEGPVDLELDWDSSRVDISLRVRDPQGNLVFSDKSDDRPKTGTFSAAVAGDYMIELTNEDRRDANYTLSVTHP